MKLFLLFVLCGIAAFTVARKRGKKAFGKKENEGEKGQTGHFFKKVMKKLSESHPELATAVEKAGTQFDELKAQGLTGKELGDRKKEIEMKLASDAGLDVSMFENMKEGATKEDMMTMVDHFIAKNEKTFPELQQMKKEFKQKRMHYDDDDDDDNEETQGRNILKKLLKKMAKGNDDLGTKMKEASQRMKELKAKGELDEETKKEMILKVATDAGVDVSMIKDAQPTTKEEKKQLVKKFIEANKANFPVLAKMNTKWIDKRMKDDADDDDDDGDDEKGGRMFLKKLLKKMAKGNDDLATKMKEASQRMKELKAKGELDEETKKEMILEVATDAGVDVSMIKNAQPTTKEEKKQLVKKFIEANKANFPVLAKMNTKWIDKRMKDDADDDDDDGDDEKGGRMFLKKLLKKMAKGNDDLATKMKEASQRMKELKAKGELDEETKKEMILEVATDAGVDVSMIKNAQPTTKEEKKQLVKKFIEANKANFPVLAKMNTRWSEKQTKDDAERDDDDDDEDDDDKRDRKRGGNGRFLKKLLKMMAKSNDDLATKMKEAKQMIKQLKSQGNVDEETKKEIILKLAKDAGVDVSMLENESPTTEAEKTKLVKKFFEVNNAKFPEIEKMSKKWGQKRKNDVGVDDDDDDDDDMGTEGEKSKKQMKRKKGQKRSQRKGQKQTGDEEQRQMGGEQDKHQTGRKGGNGGWRRMVDNGGNEKAQRKRKKIKE